MANHFKFSGDYFVSAIGGNDSNAGSADAPFQTIGAALTAAQAAGDYKTIIIGTGVYNEALAMGSNYGYHTFQGDGDVYLDGAGIDIGLTGYHQRNLFVNIKFVNFPLFHSGEQQQPMFKECKFRNIDRFGSGRQRYYQPYYFYHDKCIIVGGEVYPFTNMLTGTYNNCLLLNFSACGMWSGTAANPYVSGQRFSGCLIDCEPGKYFWSGGNTASRKNYERSTRIQMLARSLS